MNMEGRLLVSLHLSVLLEYNHMDVLSTISLISPVDYSLCIRNLLYGAKLGFHVGKL